ncbi:MAG: aldehyde dehydrogenase family protein, partial [Phycisphaerales bacterium]|nr:aldehyde dehydrogenase family protein [Phycisphaerales bacterium]
GLISPWNLPLYLLTWKIAPALATGNTAVCKPSEVTPLTAFLLGELVVEAGLPPGVLNIVHGRGGVAGAALVTHDRVPTVSFTGSTGVGRWIGRECGERLKRVSLELGGKNPFIVCQDADLDAAVATAVRAGFTNQGQICLCGSRLLLHESIADAFLQRFVAGVKALKIGDPSDAATRFGALTSREHLAKVESYVQMARDLGGTILCGGSRVDPASLPERCRTGLFFQPTVIDGLASDCRVETEEIFGPVVTVQRFKTDDEALRLANGTSYGLAAVVFSQDISRVNRLSSGLHAGIVWVNCWMVRDLRTPFGGAKQSGVGREGGLEAMRFFTEPKNVCIRS